MKKLSVLSLVCLFLVMGCATDDAIVVTNPELATFTAKIDQDIAEVKAKLPIVSKNIQIVDLNRQEQRLIYSVKLLNNNVNLEEFKQSGLKENYAEELCYVPSSKSILENGFTVIYSYVFEDGTIDIKTELADCQQQQNSENN